MLLSPYIPPTPVFTFWRMTAHSFQALCQPLLLSPCREADGKPMLSLPGWQWEIQTMQPLTHPQKPSSWSHPVTTIKTQIQFALLSQFIWHLPGTLPSGPRKAIIWEMRFSYSVGPCMASRYLPRRGQMVDSDPPQENFEMVSVYVKNISRRFVNTNREYNVPFLHILVNYKWFFRSFTYW